MMDPRAQATLGGVLVTNPWWIDVFSYIAQGASWIAAICGAVIGIHGVLKIIRERRK